MSLLNLSVDDRNCRVCSDYSWLGVDRLGPDGPIETIRKGREKETEEAPIAATAEWNGLILVTEDQRLGKAAGRRGILVWDWPALRAKIDSLSVLVNRR